MGLNFKLENPEWHKESYEWGDRHMLFHTALSVTKHKDGVIRLWGDPSDTKPREGIPFNSIRAAKNTQRI